MKSPVQFRCELSEDLHRHRAIKSKGNEDSTASKTRANFATRPPGTNSRNNLNGRTGVAPATHGTPANDPHERNRRLTPNANSLICLERLRVARFNCLFQWFEFGHSRFFSVQKSQD